MDKALPMIGMAKRAGRVSSGEFIVSKAIKDRSAKLVIIACDTSDSTKKSIIDSCTYYKVKYIEYASKDGLGKFTGSDYRAVVSINDNGFAKAILDKVNKDFTSECSEER